MNMQKTAIAVSLLLASGSVFAAQAKGGGDFPTRPIPAASRIFFRA